MKLPRLAPLTLAALLGAWALTGGAAERPLPPGLELTDTVVGAGEEVTAESVVEVHYTGRLTDGTVFDSSRSRGTPVRFQLGTGRVIRGWELGLPGMRAGGQRTLRIPPDLAYGARGAGSAVPPNATIEFDVEVVSVRAPGFENITVATAEERLAAGVKVIDIRRPDEWRSTGVLKGSVLLTAFDERGRLVRTFPAALSKLVEPDEPFIIICRTGSRTSVLANVLAEQAGYSRVASVQQGIERWIADGRPVTRTR